MFDTLTLTELYHLHTRLTRQISDAVDVIIGLLRLVSDPADPGYVPHWIPEGQNLIVRAKLIKASNDEARETLDAIGAEIDRRNAEQVQDA